jgi:preprotein translocase subunit SecG
MKWAVALLIGFAIIVVGFRYAGWLLSLFFVFNCLVLIIVVLLQSGKAADLAGAFGGAGSQTAFGPRGAATILSQATTWCAVMFMVCAMAMVLRTDKAVEQGGGSVLQNVSKPAPKKAPATPAATPAAPQPVAPSTPPGTPAAPQPVAPTPTKQPDAPQPATQQPAQQAPATSQPASAPPKKP